MREHFPHDANAERDVLSGCLFTVGQAEALTDQLSDDDFFVENHRIIFRAVRAIVDQGHHDKKIVEPRTVVRQIEINGETLPDALHVLDAMRDATVPTTMSRRSAVRVRETATLRRMIDAGTHMVQRAASEPENVPQAVEELLESAYRAAEGKEVSSAQTSAEVMAEVMAEAQDIFENGTDPRGVRFGFDDLDKISYGAKPGDLIILAARPAMGKTSLGLQVTQHVGDQDKDVLVLSLEMENKALGYRILGMESRIPAVKIQNGELSADEFPKLLAAQNRIAQRPVHYDYVPSITVPEIRSAVRRYSRRLASRGRELGLVMIDYLSLISSHARSENRNLEISDMTRSFKIMAGEYEVPVLLLAQLSRACEMRQDKRPMLSDLRDSGAIEQDADKVLFIYRDEVYNGERSEDRGTAEVIVSKHRNGPTGTARLAFLSQYAQFAPLARGGIAA